MQQPDPLPDRLPNAAGARVSRDKLRHYLLRRDHEAGGSKARFLATLGYTASDSDRLRANLIEAVQSGRPVGWTLGHNGSAAWAVLIELEGPTSSAAMISVWEVLAPGNTPRLITAYPARRHGRRERW